MRYCNYVLKYLNLLFGAILVLGILIPDDSLLMRCNLDIQTQLKKDFLLVQVGKVEKILKGSLDLIPSPSPSVKIHIIGGKVYLFMLKITIPTF